MGASSSNVIMVSGKETPVDLRELHQLVDFFLTLKGSS